ncbi:hypothetical protein [Alcaligenes sp. WGS1538]|uniref:hypothetical protein n=1 Tax=Alcaligenes sp. WGS1538 TaxID=3366811 RepID=UPI00372D1AC1
MKTVQRLAAGVLGLSALWAGAAWSHALMLSAQSGEQGVTGQLFYSDGTPAVDERVEFFAQPGPIDGDPRHYTQTDPQGRFAWPDAPDGHYLAVAYGMEGHRAQAEVAVSAASAGSAVPAAQAADLALIRQDIARLEARVRLSDIVGGIGYIVGLAGAYLYWLSRRRPR